MHLSSRSLLVLWLAIEYFLQRAVYECVCESEQTCVCVSPDKKQCLAAGAQLSCGAHSEQPVNGRKRAPGHGENCPAEWRLYWEDQGNATTCLQDN